MYNVDITLIDKICTNCKECVKETSLQALTTNSRVSIFNSGILSIKTINENYITFCITQDSCNIIRNCSIGATIPICLNCQVVKVKVDSINEIIE